MWSTIAADQVFRVVQYPIYSRNYQMGGPARPSSPFESDHPRIHNYFEPGNHTEPAYSLRNPQYNDYVHKYASIPPLFGVRYGFTSGPFWDVVDVVAGDMYIDLMADIGDKQNIRLYDNELR